MAKQKNSKVISSTEKPILNEMRIIGGRVMVWSGSKWLTEQEHAKLYINNDPKH